MDKKEIRDRIAGGWLNVHLVFEVLGKPADYVENALEMLLEKLSKEKNLEFLGKKIHKAKPVEKTEKVFTAFAEVEILINKLPRIIEIIFDYMPSSIEIVEPTNLAFKNEDMNALINDLAARLHQYDAILKKLKIERTVLIKRLSEELKKKEGKEKSE
ncbi:MAG: hypothetical protein IB618_02315 [Candidatus Pacearchaeota archaeon]|nr:MAG: hypothetical protein IB618_02315 [Candidatus Pacearchaeota archaeon]